MMETPNGLKLILVTSVRNDNNPELVLNNIYENYINLVKKNYLYKVGEPIKVSRFE